MVCFVEHRAILHLSNFLLEFFLMNLCCTKFIKMYISSFWSFHQKSKPYDIRCVITPANSVLFPKERIYFSLILQIKYFKSFTLGKLWRKLSLNVFKVKCLVTKLCEFVMTGLCKFN